MQPASLHAGPRTKLPEEGRIRLHGRIEMREMEKGDSGKPYQLGCSRRTMERIIEPVLDAMSSSFVSSEDAQPKGVHFYVHR